LCYGCHSYLDRHPKEKEILFRSVVGDKEYDDLEILSHESYSGWKKDAPEIKRFYKEAFYKELKNLNDNS